MVKQDVLCKCFRNTVSAQALRHRVNGVTGVGTLPLRDHRLKVAHTSCVHKVLNIKVIKGIINQLRLESPWSQTCRSHYSSPTL